MKVVKIVVFILGALAIFGASAMDKTAGGAVAGAAVGALTGKAWLLPPKVRWLVGGSAR